LARKKIRFVLPLLILLSPLVFLSTTFCFIIFLLCSSGIKNRENDMQMTVRRNLREVRKEVRSRRSFI